jgi:hypothetical protein
VIRFLAGNSQVQLGQLQTRIIYPSQTFAGGLKQVESNQLKADPLLPSSSPTHTFGCYVLEGTVCSRQSLASKVDSLDKVEAFWQLLGVSPKVTSLASDSVAIAPGSYVSI